MAVHEELIPLLYQAFGSRYGLALRVSDFTLAQQRLYAARRAAQDPDLELLQIRRPGSDHDPDSEHTLWLVKATPKSPTTELILAPET